jgi:hypothetical protein
MALTLKDVENRGSPEGLKIFLSHAREDKEQAAALYARLERQGFSPWIDEKDLLPGQPWRMTIQRAIREADVFLVLLSRHSSKRGPERRIPEYGAVASEFHRLVDLCRSLCRQLLDWRHPTD